MNLNHAIKLLLISALIVVSGSGCVYYNTFFNAKKKFQEAERIQNKNRQNNPNPGGIARGQKGKGAGQPPNIRGGRNQSGPVQSNVSPQVKLLYEEAIKRASKVLKFHPESKYVDDALWLVGKSYFNMGDYLLADRKFQELVINHPESKFADDSYFYSGLCQMELDKDDLALKAFAKVESAYKKSPFIDDVYFAKGMMAKNAENYTAAIDQFNMYIEKFPKGDSAAKAVFCVGQCRDKMDQYYEAYKTYSNVKNYGPDRELYFDAMLAASVAVLKTDSIYIGMKILEDLANNERYFSHSAQIRLRIAEGLYRQGDIDRAIDEYTSVTVEYPRTDESAEAYFRLGLIYQGDIFDIDKAKESFNKAQNEKPTSEYRSLAMNRAAQIAKLESYRNQLHAADSLVRERDNIKSDTLSGEIELPPADSSGALLSGEEAVEIHDELIAEFDSLETAGSGGDRDTIPDITSEGPDSLFIGPLEETAGVDENSVIGEGSPDGAAGEIVETAVNQDSIDAAAAARQDSIRNEIIHSAIETRFLLGELYAYELNQPDSAINEYLILMDEHPESPFAVRGLLAAANIEFNRQDSLKAKEYLRMLVERYAESPQAVQASEMLNYPINLSENAVGLYTHAESLVYYRNMPDSALKVFRYIADRFPDLAPKAYYASAWTLESMIEDMDSSAVYAYIYIKDNYPQTEYASAARVKLGLDNSSKRTVRRRERDPEEELEGKFENAVIDPDSAEVIALGLPNAPPVSELGAFLYPEELLDRDLKGRVLFKIKIDITGRVQDYEIIGPSGQRAIDSVATFALLETEFDVSDFNFAQLDAFFKYSISFERPEIDIFNDPYRERRERESR